MTITLPLSLIITISVWLFPTIYWFKTLSNDHDTWGMGGLMTFVLSVMWGLFDLLILMTGAYFKWWAL